MKSNWSSIRTLKWDEEIIERFYLDDDSAELTAAGGSGKIITLKLTGPTAAKNLSYVRGGKWRQEQAIIWAQTTLRPSPSVKFPYDLQDSIMIIYFRCSNCLEIKPDLPNRPTL